MFLDAEQDVRQTEKKLCSQLHPWKFTGLNCAWGLKYRWLMTMGLRTIKKGLKRSQSTVNQTRGVWQGLVAPFVSSYTEVAKVICLVGLSPFVGTVRCKFISPEMENSGAAEAAGLWSNGNQSKLNCNTIPDLSQSHWVSLYLDNLLCTELHAVPGQFLKPVISERECQGVLKEALPQPSV